MNSVEFHPDDVHPPSDQRTTSIASRHFLQLLDGSRSVMLFTTVSLRAEPPRFLRMLKSLSYLTEARSLPRTVPHPSRTTSPDRGDIPQPPTQNRIVRVQTGVSANVSDTPPRFEGMLNCYDRDLSVSGSCTEVCRCR